MIKYLGSKRKLIKPILDAISDPTGKLLYVCDLFSGTARVSMALREAGHYVTAVDSQTYATTIADAYLNGHFVGWGITEILQELNHLQGYDGWFSEAYSEKARFFQHKNGIRAQAIGDRIKALRASQTERGWLVPYLLTSLMEALDRVDSTCGIQMAYLKDWAPRANNPLELRLLELPKRVDDDHNGGKCIQGDALEVLHDLNCVNVPDVLYLDPPYNQHSYAGNYHIWNTVCRWDNPETYGVANKRIDVRTEKSPLNSKPGFKPYFEKLVAEIRSPKTVVSFSNEGFVTPEWMMETLSKINGGSKVEIREFDYERYVGAKIGIYSPSGVITGEISHTTNKEYLFIATQE